MSARSIALASTLALFPAAAFAQDPAQGPSAMFQILFFGGFILIFWLLVLRPQSKRAKEHRELIGGLSKGDEVVTNGGIAGKVTKVADDFLTLEIADGVEIKVQKVAVVTALPKGTLKEV